MIDSQVTSTIGFPMGIELQKMLKNLAEKSLRPDGTTYHRLTLADENEIARVHKISNRETQLLALSCDVIPERYCRNQHSITVKEQISLLQSEVVVIGQGGLGGTVTELLSRLGIGALTLVDGDTFEESNLNRQILCTTGNLGKSKAEAGRDRVQAINPAIEVKSIHEFVDKNNATSIIKDANVVVDCLDSISTRFIVEQVCKEEKIPMVSAAIGGSVGQATVVFPEDDGLRLIYGNSNGPDKGIETHQGTLAYAATLMAAVQCAEVVNLICTGTSSLHNHLLIAEIDDKNFVKILLHQSNGE